MAGAALGGAELFFERLCLGLHAAGDEVLPVIRRNAVRSARLREAGLTPVELGFGSRLDLLTRPRLRAALSAFAPQVVVTLDEPRQLAHARGDWVLVGRLGGYYDLRYYRNCDHLVGNTRGIVAWLRAQGWPSERTHYVPNFVEDFAGVEPAPDVAALGRPLLLGLGRLHTDKGFDTLIRAMGRLPGAHLAIAGEGPERHRLATLAARERVADRVHFLGWRRDAGALLRAADVFVCSSRVEPLGNMVIEAWSAGCPVVAVAADGPGELMRDGDSGVLVSPEDPAALADAIAGILHDRDRAKSLAAAGRRRFEFGVFRHACHCKLAQVPGQRGRLVGFAGPAALQRVDDIFQWEPLRKWARSLHALLRHGQQQTTVRQRHQVRHKPLQLQQPQGRSHTRRLDRKLRASECSKQIGLSPLASCCHDHQRPQHRDCEVRDAWISGLGGSV